MKYCMLLLMFVSAAVGTKAQSKGKPVYHYNYKQYQWLDSLHNAHPLSTALILPDYQVACNMPAATLQNESEITGMSGEDTVYKMKTDNMLTLKPTRNANEPLNVANGKIFMMDPADIRP